MMQTRTSASIYPKKILLAVFIFAILILVGKIVYSQFDTISLQFLSSSNDPDLATMVAPEFFHQQILESDKRADPALVLFRSKEAAKDVLWFYTHITGDERIAQIILDNASKNNIPPSLAFALAWVESRYKSQAVNKNAASIDRGLFQLNNKAFPKLTEKDFFDPQLNAHYGLTHLSYCIDLSGNEVAALAMYNAGTTKVRKDATPKRTLDYISYILNYRDRLDVLFAQQVLSRYEIAGDDSVRIASKR